MTENEKRLKRLQNIAGALADQALRPVMQATAEIQRIEARIAELSGHRAKLTASASDPSIAGTMLSQAERLRVKQAAALSELASAHVALDKARRAAAKAVGRNHALGAIADKKKAAAERKARRRFL